MPLYTKRGDSGETDLFNGDRVAKHNPRVEAYGQVDELNAVLGWARSAVRPEIEQFLASIQGHLFEMGSDLATPTDAQGRSKRVVPQIGPSHTQQLEMWIDQAEGMTPRLTQFVLPAGTEAACRLHIGRTVCRRVERALGAFSADHPLNADNLIYLNRLSDLLFAWARWENHAEGQGDVGWTAPTP